MSLGEEPINLEEQFDAAVKVVWSLPEEGPFQPSDDMMMMFYSYHKQATCGPCNIPRPIGFWDPNGKAKWDAWNALGNMTREDAMKKYLEDIQLILETIPVSDEVSDLVQKLGDFYTEVEGEDVVGKNHEKSTFTRPFASQKDELLRSIKKPTLEGYGDLWEDIQNIQEKDIVHSVERAQEEDCGDSFEKEEERNELRKSEEEDHSCEAKTADDEKEEEKDCSLDPRYLTVQRWRCDTVGSTSSVEPSMSSCTNGTHSSLNSEVEEEELACCVEHSVANDLTMHFNGLLSEHDVELVKKKGKILDSDNEEFCDSMENLAAEEDLPKPCSPGTRVDTVRQSDCWFESSMTMIAEESGCALTDESYLSDSPAGNINQRIALALLKLQHDMTKVLQRLHTLEVLTQSRSSSPQRHTSMAVVRMLLRPSWWPFEHSTFTVALTSLWPFISYWLVQFVLQQKKR
ncbi:acyl-CoA-binding domain-containing protein 5A-like [Neosynchiropus ocellatus]